MNPLRTKMTEDMRLRGLSDATKKHYLCFVAAFAKHYQACPSQLGTTHIRDFLLLLEDLGRASSTLNVYYCALRFFYVVTLERPDVLEGIVRPKKKPRDQIPAPTPEEVRALFDATVRPYDLTILRLLYATGMRASEGRALQTHDVDARTGLLHIRHGKGDKARSVPLSERLLQELRAHWDRYRPPGPWLFPATAWHIECPRYRPVWDDRPLTANAFERRFDRIRDRAQLKRRICLHDLRRAYATHLFESGVDVRHIQLLLGHTDSRQTDRYVTVRASELRRTPCTLDQLD